MMIRNFLFDRGICEQRAFSVPVISVGNITVGGTGKTPMVEFLVSALGGRYRLAVLSRGYKRRTRGYRLAGPSDTPDTIGDEPCQVKQRFPSIDVAVAERRVEGIEALMREDQKPDVILLDDAYQHRHVKPGLSILLVDYNRPLWNDMPFPGGRLREFARGARRADLVVFTKCPADVSAVAMDKMVSKVRGARPETTFFAGITYLSPRAVVSGNADSLLFCNNPSFVLLTGVASATGLVQYLREQGSLKKHFEFPDHYFFTPRDIEQVETYARNENLVIITTQKDAVRLLHMPLSAWMKEHLYYLPITTSFVDGREKEFVYQVYKYLANA